MTRPARCWHESRAKGGKHTGGRTYGYTSARRVDGGPVGYAPVAALHAMLHNERYIGRLIWNRTLWRKDPDSAKRICVERPESEWVRHTDERLRLVTDATWQRVRGRDTPIGSSNARPKYPLSDLLLCGECGHPMTISGGVNARGFGSHRYVCSTYREHGKTSGIGCSNDMSVSRAVAEEFLIEPLRARLMADDNFRSALDRLERAHPDNAWLYETAQETPPGPAPDDAELAARVAAKRAAEAAGAMSRRDAESHCSRLRADHERAKSGALPVDPAGIAANAEALRAALVNGAMDALRAALRRTLGTVRLTPVTDEGPRYLNARFEGGDMPLLTWLALGDAANQPALRW